MKGPVGGVLVSRVRHCEHYFEKGRLFYGDDTRVSVPLMKAMIESDFLFFWARKSVHIPENGARKTISPTQ
jgi:hypothetical protein